MARFFASLYGFPRDLPLSEIEKILEPIAHLQEIRGHVSPDDGFVVTVETHTGYGLDKLHEFFYQPWIKERLGITVHI